MNTISSITFIIINQGLDFVHVTKCPNNGVLNERVFCFVPSSCHEKTFDGFVIQIKDGRVETFDSFDLSLLVKKTGVVACIPGDLKYKEGHKVHGSQ